MRVCIYQERMVSYLLPRGSASSSAFFFLQSLTSFSLTEYLRPAALFPHFSAVSITFSLKAAMYSLRVCLPWSCYIPCVETCCTLTPVVYYYTAHSVHKSHPPRRACGNSATTATYTPANTVTSDASNVQEK